MNYLDESGAIVTNAPAAWTGTTANGSAAGDMSKTNSEWTFSNFVSCTALLHLYCIAQ